MIAPSRSRRMHAIRLAACATLAAGLVAAVGPASAAGLVGTMVNPTFAFPTAADVIYNGGTVTVTGGNTFSAFDLSLRIDDDGFTVTNSSPGVYFNTPFLGWVVNFVGGTTVQDASLLAGGSPAFASGAVVTFNSNQVFVNVAGTCGGCTGGESFRVAVSAVPEPSTWAMLGAGVAALAWMGRRRKGGASAAVPGDRAAA